MFNLSISLCVVLNCFLKINHNSCAINDFRPVAMTSVIIKCLEQPMKRYINNSIPVSNDPLQFAYRSNRAVNDAVFLALQVHTVLQHLEGRDTYVRMMFVDYSSAFNTIRPCISISKLLNLGLCNSICRWLDLELHTQPLKC